MSDTPSPGRAGEDPEERAPARSPEEVAREIGAPAPGGARHADDDALREGGPLKLDKSGALAGRPKLRPVRAHRREGEEADADDRPAQRAGAPARSSRARKAVLPPKLGGLRPAEAAAPADDDAATSTPADDMVALEAGTFLYGDARKPRDVPAFRIDRFPVTNAAYAAFATATGHRTPLYWPGGVYPQDLADHPVVGVDYFDALAYAQWCGKDLPHEDEWERAARGTDGRIYPWGNDQELSGANTARVGLKMTVPVDLHRENVSPDGVRDMVGNVWELTHSPAPGGGVVVRGGSWYDFALYAKTFFRFASRADARNGTIGFRCVLREAPRDEVRREIDPEHAAAEIAARQGQQPPVDVTSWSVEKRDLVPDLPRLRSYVLEARAEALLGAKPAPLPEPPPSVSLPPPPPPPEPEPEPEPRVVAEAEADVEADVEVEVEVEVEPAPAERIHVHDTRPGAAVARGRATRDRLALERQARRAEQAQTARRAAGRLPAGGRGMPVWMWGLLALGFLLFGGLLVTLVNRGETPPGPDGDTLPAADSPTPAPRSRVADLPEPWRYEEFPGANEPPRVLDAAYPSDVQRVEAGLWLLLFVDPDTSEGRETLEAAHQLHRRVAPAGVHVTVVLPRAPYEDDAGKLLDDEKLDAALKADGQGFLWDALHVVLDPRAPDGRGRLHARYASPTGPVCAVLLHEGLTESRTTPVEGGFRLETLAGVALRALELTVPR